MLSPHRLESLDENELCRLAELIALKIKSGDVIALTGDLGAGKTTFARALIRAVLGDRTADVPSPTFSLVQSYRSARLSIAHADLYRLSDPADVAELGLADAVGEGAVIVEWPERGDGIEHLGERLDVVLEDVPDDPARRHVTLSASHTWEGRARRIVELNLFLRAARAPFALDRAAIDYLQGDASPRGYARISSGGNSVVLMDAPRQPDGPAIRDGLPYSRIAHLAEDVRPFVAIDNALRKAGLSAPAIHTVNLDAGLMLIEDLGTGVFGTALDHGLPQRQLWLAATDVLVALRQIALPVELPVADGAAPHKIPPYDRDALTIETGLLVDWYWTAVKGCPIGAAARAEFEAAWAPVIGRLVGMERGLVLRDYHSPNLVWLPKREGRARVGLLDFQDAVRGPWAYDLVSLLQDARLDVPPELEAELLDHYCSTVADDRSFDPAQFKYAYAALGAQRNTKILGIFARLARRDGKTQYLRHVPRIWGYLARNLAHPDLAQLRAWYDEHLTQDERARPLLGRQPRHGDD